ncbi:MAG TPA: aa3-type cytochrome c oxidase subunit IV [Devosiaceae bacterium]|jgi:hypothetical protein|nr:aa3-type cytochrome c oxidase subunit IV [Devosiaceae bacterium]
MANQPTVAHSANNTHGHTAPADGPGSAMDYAAHEATYRRFTGLVKWGIISCAVLLIFLFIVIRPMIETAAS